MFIPLFVTTNSIRERSVKTRPYLERVAVSRNPLDDLNAEAR